VEETLSAWLHASRERDFLLVIGGRKSGIHDGKGKHRPLDYQTDGSTVIIQFDGSEQLIISGATEIIMHASGELVVKDASEARFAWYAQDNPKNAPKLCEEVFRKVDRFIDFSRIGASFITSGGFAYGSDQFVVLPQ
jgi:hypothetical protein